MILHTSWCSSPLTSSCERLEGCLLHALQTGTPTGGSVRRCYGAGLVGRRHDRRCSRRGGPWLPVGPSTASLTWMRRNRWATESAVHTADGGEGATRDDDDNESVETDTGAEDEDVDVDVDGDVDEELTVTRTASTRRAATAFTPKCRRCATIGPARDRWLLRGCVLRAVLSWASSSWHSRTSTRTASVGADFGRLR